ncbi:hypothetical protein Q8F55_005897 [Vanrija albida]|uniref:Uncharacterized protein n=1 Tax=Vanrija albida TaxID=181172 RepID=A0ABR3Q2V4_9TREE
MPFTIPHSLQQSPLFPLFPVLAAAQTTIHTQQSLNDIVALELALFVRAAIARVPVDSHEASDARGMSIYLKNKAGEEYESLNVLARAADELLWHRGLPSPSFGEPAQVKPTTTKHATPLAPISPPLSSAPPSPSLERKVLRISHKPATLADLFSDDEPKVDEMPRTLPLEEVSALHAHVCALNDQSRDLQGALALLDLGAAASATSFEVLWRRARLGWRAEEIEPAARRTQYSPYPQSQPSPPPTHPSALPPPVPASFLPTLAIPPTLAANPEFPRFPSLVEHYRDLGGVPVPTPSDTLLQVYQFTQAVSVDKRSTAEQLMAAEVLKLGVVYAQNSQQSNAQEALAASEARIVQRISDANSELDALRSDLSHLRGDMRMLTLAAEADQRRRINYVFAQQNRNWIFHETPQGPIPVQNRFWSYETLMDLETPALREWAEYLSGLGMPPNASDAELRRVITHLLGVPLVG